MKRASCVCGVDLTDGRVMISHLIAYPAHRQILMQADAQLWMLFIKDVHPETQEVDFEMHKVNIKKVR